ncbi:hypothetical protein EDD11_006569 [Mortierella claussenii]|nr:hypothetical protein EDD11_006569 [Mortierella claussenii]
MSLIKSACLAASAWSYFMTSQAPPSSNTVSPENNDQVLDEGWLKFFDEKRLPMVINTVGVFQATTYLVLMSKASAPLFTGNAAIHQLTALKPWQVGFTVACLSSYALRRWCYYTLDRFFTFKLTIRQGHQLVDYGPYRFLRHPSYTAVIINGICFYGLLWHEGLYEVLASYLGRIAGWALNRTVVVPSKVLGVPGGVLVTAYYTYLMMSLVTRRVTNEETMLKKHFGKTWDAFASKRWRFFPLIY